MVLSDTRNHPWRQTCSLRPQRHISLHYAEVSPISSSWNVYKRTTQWILGCPTNEFSIKECLTEIYKKLNSSIKCKERPWWIYILRARTDFFVDNMIYPNYFENEFVQTFGTVGYWLEKCGIWFAIFLFIKLIIDIVVVVMRTLEVHRITGKSVNFGKVLLSAAYNLFMVSILNSVYSPAKPIGSSTPIAAEMQESTEHIYPSVPTLPNNSHNTVSPV